MTTSPTTRLALCGLVLGLASGSLTIAEEIQPQSATPPIPLTREDVKQVLEASKEATPRLPLPPLSDEEKARAAEAAEARGTTNSAPGLGGGIVNNARMRNYYLSDYSTGSGNRDRGRSNDDPRMTLGYPFKTSLFWIVSRGNNCTYCLGHQESKLSSAGLTDDQIAALDGDWSEFDPAQRAAFAFTKTLSFAPHTLSDADIEALRPHFTDDQITEIILTVAGNNATNRWTSALRIPQEGHRVYLTPTSPKYASMLTSLAPASGSNSGKGLVPPAPQRRPALEAAEEVQAALEAARQRTARLPVADAETARVLTDGSAGEEPAQWVRLLCVFPESGVGRVISYQAALERGTLDARTKAIIAYVSARHDRAWYALGHALERLHGLGFTDEQIAALDDPKSLDAPADREVASFTRTLTADPAMVSDDDVARLRQHFDDKKVAEIVYQVTQAAFFDRLTEAAGLPLETSPATR